MRQRITPPGVDPAAIAVGILVIALHRGFSDAWRNRGKCRQSGGGNAALYCTLRPPR